MMNVLGMRHLTGGLYRDGQRPDEFVARIALLGPEDPDQPDRARKGGGKGHTHA
jgi:hypothetical protein